MLEKIEVTLVGTAPLIMHNGRLSDPLNEHAKALAKLSAKRKKTEDEIAEMRHVEWIGGLYLDNDGRVALPSDNILALVIGGAKKSKRGKEAGAGVFETQPFYRLVYPGPNDAMALYDKGFVRCVPARVGMSRVMRTRPMFREWKLPVQLYVNSDIIDVAHVVTALEVAGEIIGLADDRPRFGRFTVEM